MGRFHGSINQQLMQASEGNTVVTWQKEEEKKKKRKQHTSFASMHVFLVEHAPAHL